MLSKLLNYLSDKKILILGFGVEGKSTYSFIRKHFNEKQIIICDEKKNEELQKDKFVKCIYNDEYLKYVDEVDIILKTPGISFKDINIKSFKHKITSQLELVLEYIDVYTIGITGTKGKSTTSSLLYQVLKKNNKEAYLLGNIGKPIFEELDNINKNSILVLELSSHALEYTKKSPNISILLNVFEEHLDHYKSYQDYVEAKYNICRFQNNSDYAIYNIDNKTIKCNLPETKAIKIPISMESERYNIVLKENNIYYNDKLVYTDNGKRHLLGMHNLNNIMFVIITSIILNLDMKITENTINEFLPLEHRMEYVGNVDDVNYYNDSIATIPESTILAIETLKNVNTLIVGGKDRGINLQELIDYLNNSSIENIICLPKTGEYIAKGIKNKKTFLVDNLQQAVDIAKNVTKKENICLLSPAASSYGYFKNFEERGNIFKTLVLKKVEK